MSSLREDIANPLTPTSATREAPQQPPVAHSPAAPSSTGHLANKHPRPAPEPKTADLEPVSE